MQGIQIVATGRALPKRIVTNDDLSKIVDTNDEWIQTRTGIKQRYYCEEETCVSLAIEAGKTAMKKAGVNPQEIGVVLVASTSSDYAFPSTACLVQKALELSKETMSFDISAACSGFLYGMNICKGLLENTKKPYALLIGSEELTRFIDFSDRASCILFGDGAGAAILRLEDNCFVHKAWSDGNLTALSCKGVANDGAKLVMDGKEVFKFAIKALEQGINAILEETHMTMEDVDYIVCHQANRRIIEHVRKKYHNCNDKFYINIECYGNTSAASIPIALDEMFELGILKSGMKVIAVGFGAGLTWSSALITI